MDCGRCQFRCWRVGVDVGVRDAHSVCVLGDLETFFFTFGGVGTEGSKNDDFPRYSTVSTYFPVRVYSFW